MDLIVFDLDLIWIEIGVLKNKKFKECTRSPCNGNHLFLYSSVLQVAGTILNS